MIWQASRFFFRVKTTREDDNETWMQSKIVIIIWRKKMHDCIQLKQRFLAGGSSNDEKRWKQCGKTDEDCVM